ncbi:ligand-dependent nuclear receptor corepressor-like protein isoform X2 [Scophthalmus maximus]|uniref:Ligand dependent nuclear receptor corepressor-like n=1 Tax=Scophthalmus maximus TaxID=52904 RepID=A0A8D3ACX2_SCOMX|nr:ligand-dependent nuclear receptor corepressor-like protein isoform X2 [Scophthalmus maximus]
MCEALWGLVEGGACCAPSGQLRARLLPRYTVRSLFPWLRGRERGEGRTMATVQCPRCTVERKGFRRELDSWRHKLIHCVGFESILGGIYGPMLLRDLNVFDDCEPEEVDDWSPEASCSQCSFCNLPLDKLSDQVPAATSPLSSPSDYSPCQAPSISESSQSAHRFLQAVFNKKDVPLGCDSNIPLVAQELMKKMVHQFAMDYASKCLIHTSTNGVRTKTSSPLSETSDAPLDLTVCRTQEEKECEPELDGVLDLSNRNPASSATSSSSSSSSSNIKVSGRKRRQKEEYIERSWELSEGLLSKALKDIRSGRLQEQRASLLYGIPLHTLKQGLDGWAERRLGMLHQLAPGSKDFRDEVTSCNMMSSMLGGEARLVLQKVAAWAERAEIGGAAEENGDLSFPSSSLTFSQPSGLQKTLTRAFPQLRDALQPPPSPTPSPEPPTPLRIPQIRSMSDHNRSTQAENCSVAENLHQRTSSTEGAASSSTPAARPSSLFKLRPPFLAHGCPGSANQSPHRLGPRSSSLDDSEEGAGSRDKDKQPRKKRGRYRQYDHDLLEEAITMVMAGRMSVSKAQGVYGVPHSTLEYKVKERTGTLKNPPKKKSANFCSSNSSSSGSGTMTGSTSSGTLASAADTKRF